MWDDLNMEMDAAFLERDRKRKAGQPVEIARTKRLVIRETILSDVPEMYRIWKEPGMGDYIKPMQETLEAEMEFMQAYIRHAYAFYDYGLWTVIERESGQIVGRAGLFPSEILDEAVELGYMIAPVHQRKGYAFESGKAILSYAGETLDMEEIHLLSDRRNEASIRTAVSLGFTEIECFHKCGRELVHFVAPRIERNLSGVDLCK